MAHSPLADRSTNLYRVIIITGENVGAFCLMPSKFDRYRKPAYIYNNPIRGNFKNRNCFMLERALKHKGVDRRERFFLVIKFWRSRQTPLVNIEGGGMRQPPLTTRCENELARCKWWHTPCWYFIIDRRSRRVACPVSSTCFFIRILFFLYFCVAHVHF